MVTSIEEQVDADRTQEWKAALKSAIRENIEDRDEWFSMSDESLTAIGRKDGQVTVLANSAGIWLVRTRTGEKLTAELMPTAKAAVGAALEVPAVAS